MAVKKSCFLGICLFFSIGFSYGQVLAWSDEGTFWYTVYKNPHFPNILIEYEAEFIGNNYCFIAF